jgi:hypothetical protein
MKDRSAGLVIFGAFQILLGLCAVCVVLGMAAVAEMQSRGGAPPMPPASAISNIVIYGLLACYFFAVGVGSIRKRRWARALSLVVSSMWLAVGIVAVGVVTTLLPKLTTIFPPSQTTWIVTMMFVVIGTVYVLLPLVLVLFYRSPHVKATCEARDPVPRWTDRVPLPILALVIAMAFAAASVIITLSYGIVPLFGVILTGAPAVIVLLAFAGLCAFLAVQLFRMKRSAWWTSVLFVVFGVVNAVVTFSRVDLEKLYEQMGIMTPQVRAMHLADLYRDPMLWIVIGVSWAAALGYLIWTRRFFDAPPPLTRASDAAIDV